MIFLNIMNDVCTASVCMDILACRMQPQKHGAVQLCIVCHRAHSSSIRPVSYQYGTIRCIFRDSHPKIVLIVPIRYESNPFLRNPSVCARPLDIGLLTVMKISLDTTVTAALLKIVASESPVMKIDATLISRIHFVGTLPLPLPNVPDLVQ